MRAKVALRIVLGIAFVMAPLCSVARSPQADHSQSASAGSGDHSTTQPLTSPNIYAPALSDFVWLEGRWRGEWGPRIAEQVWLSPKAGAMEGVFRVVEADKTLVLELFTLVQKTDGISFYIRHFTPTLAPWEKSDATVLNFTKAENRRFTFENPVDGMPKLAVFTQVDPDTYVSRSEIVPETGDSQAVEITYKRQPASTLPINAGSGGHQKKP